MRGCYRSAMRQFPRFVTGLPCLVVMVALVAVALAGVALAEVALAAPLAARAAPAGSTPAIESELRYNLDEAQYGAASAELLGKGYRLADLSVFAVGQRLVVSGIWERHPGDPPASADRVRGLSSLQHLKLTRAQMDAFGERQLAIRSVPEMIEGYRMGDAIYFDVVFSPPAGIAMGHAAPALLRPGLGQTQLDARKAGLELARVDAYADNHLVYFNPVYIPGPAIKRQSTFGLDAVLYAERADALALEGARPASITAYVDDRSSRPTLLYAGIFDPPGKPARTLVLDKTPMQFEVEFRKHRKLGDRIIDIDGGAVSDGDRRYSAIFEATR